MKSTLNYLIFYAFIINIFSCTSETSKFGIEDEIVISGKILGYSEVDDKQTILIDRRDFFGRNETVTSTISANGNFEIKFPSFYDQEFYIEYGSLITVFCRSGDSLYLEIDSDILLDKRNKHPNGRYFATFGNNSIGDINNNIQLFLETLRNEKTEYGAGDNAEKNYLPAEYIEYINQREIHYLSFLDSFELEYNTSKIFNAWAIDRIKYSSLDDLMRYPINHAYYNGFRQDSVFLPNDYFRFLMDVDLNDNQLFSIAHQDFLNELFMYSIQNPKDSLQKVIELYEQEDYREAFSTYSRMMSINTYGFAEELLLSKLYFSLLNSNQLDIFNIVFDSSSIDQRYFLEFINEEKQRLTSYLSNQNTEYANISSLSSSITKAIIDTISMRYQGSVIYIDFWAPWCSPCMLEMPHSKIIQDYFSSEKVVFLFFGNQCNEESWKSTIANEKLSGEHILLTEDQFAILSSFFGIGGIPHYTLIDKQGKVVWKDAPRPSEKEQLIEEIGKLLN